MTPQAHLLGCCCVARALSKAPHHMVLDVVLQTAYQAYEATHTKTSTDAAQPHSPPSTQVLTSRWLFLMPNLLLASPVLT